MIKRSRALIAGGITPAIIRGCVAEHRKTVDRFQKLENYYVGKHAILRREQVNKDSPNNRIVANFPKYITDTAIGYMFGSPVAYQSEQQLDSVKAAFERTDADTHDAELGKDLSVFGVGYELVYMSDGEKPEPLLALLDPREAFVVYDDTVAAAPLFGVYYCKRHDADGSVAGYKIHVCTDAALMVYNARELGDYPVLEEEFPHYFGGVPVVQYWNNEEGMGDFEHVISEIDAYNTLQSDRVNDKERFVSALLVVEGAEFDDEKSVKEALDGGVINTPPQSKVYYLTKTLNEAETDILRQSLSDDIHKFTHMPDFSDENFAGNASGVAMQFKLTNLENMAKVKQGFFTAGLRERLKLFARILYVQGKPPIDPAGIKITFNRTLPVNELETAQTVAMYASSGTVSKETLLTRISFVKDKDDELKKLAAEQAAKEEAAAKAFGGNVDDIRL